MIARILNGLIFILAIFAIVPLSAFAQEQLEVPFEFQGRTMGPIIYKVIIGHHPESVTPTELQFQTQSALDRVNDLMSTYLPESDVSRFNASTSTEFFPVDAETAKVVHRAIEISRQTEGAFDITVGPAVNLWNFGPGKTGFQPPTDSAIEALKQIVGYEMLTVSLDPPAIKKSNPAVKIDLSAIAKGYAVDQVGKVLDGAGCEKYMVEVGGEVTTRGERFDGGPWRIGVEYPTENMTDPSGKPAGIAAISNLAMATSGDYRNFEKLDGKRYSHSIDPKTCRPVTHALATACIVTKDCMTADALATAVTVLGAEQGAAVCEKLGVQYFLMERDSDFGSKFTRTVSTGFPLLSIEPNSDEVVKENSGESIWPAFIGAAIIFGLVVLAMAVGSIFGNKPITGSCGGLANMTSEDGESNCGVCSKPTTDCIENPHNQVGV